MTRLERIREYLRAHGPKTTRQIAEVMGWKISSASAVISHARSHGYIELARTIPHPRGQGSPIHVWDARTDLIRRPSTRRPSQ